MERDFTMLEKRVEQLEYQIEQLMQLAGSERDPFTYHMMEADASPDQVKAVFALLRDYAKRIREGTETRSHGHFEAEVYKIFPSRHGNYHFAEGIVSTLGRMGDFPEIYDYMMRSGMNLHPLKS